MESRLKTTYIEMSFSRNWRVLGALARKAFLLACVGWASLALAAAEIPTSGVRHLFDITGQGAGGLALPTDVTVGDDGRIFVVDGGNHRIVAFDRRGKYLFAFGQKGSGEGQFRDPVGIGIDSRGRIYVADTSNHRVQVFGSDGRFQYAFRVSDGGTPVRPIDVATDPAGGRIYVTGNNNHKVMEFRSGGAFVRQWGGQGESSGQFRYPASIQVATDGSVYVVDVLNSRAQGFDPDGTLLLQVGNWGVLPGQFFRPKGIAVDAKKRVYIGDSYMDVIQVFDDEGHLLHVLGRKGAPQRFVSVGGISIGQDNRLYAAEIMRNKVSVYSIE